MPPPAPTDPNAGASRPSLPPLRGQPGDNADNAAQVHRATPVSPRHRSNPCAYPPRFPLSKKGNGGRKIAFTTTRSSLRIGVEELYPGLTQKKMCKDMFKKCPAAALASSHAHNGADDDAPGSALRGPAPDATPSGTPHCKNACA